MQKLQAIAGATLSTPRKSLSIWFLATTRTVLSTRDEGAFGVFCLRNVHGRVDLEEVLRAERDLQGLNRHPESCISTDVKHTIPINLTQGSPQGRVYVSALQVNNRYECKDLVYRGLTHRRL